MQTLTAQHGRQCLLFLSLFGYHRVSFRSPLLGASQPLYGLLLTLALCGPLGAPQSVFRALTSRPPRSSSLALSSRVLSAGKPLRSSFVSTSTLGNRCSLSILSNTIPSSSFSTCLFLGQFRSLSLQCFLKLVQFVYFFVSSLICLTFDMSYGHITCLHVP